MTDDNKKADDVNTEQTATPSSQTPAAGLKRRELLRNVGVGSVATGLGAATYLRGFERSRMRAMAQDGGPVKIGFIEDESGNLAVYGLQKLHAAQLAVKEINEGKTLKGDPNIGAGMLGVL
jgi:branched-chain amino acid transport system substrate-binding protein